MKINLSDRKIQERIRREYEKSLAKLLPIKEKLAKTDWLIDQIIYKLYGLTNEEIAIVEGKNEEAASAAYSEAHDSSATKLSESPALYDDKIEGLVKTIVAEIDPQKIILFGSGAKGTAKSGSDMDLLVVTQESICPGKNRLELLGSLYKRLAGVGVAKEILLYSQDEIEKWKGSKNHVVARALKEGKMLYERP